MAREILLRLAVRNFERARDVAARIAERAERTLAAAKSVSDELRTGFERAQKTAALRERGAATGARGANPTTEGSIFDRGAFRALGQVNQARGRGAALGRALFGGGEPSQTLPSLMTLAGAAVPGLGPFMALLAPLTQQLLSYLEERLAQELARREQALVTRLEEDRLRSDYTRRLEEDPAFRRQQARLAFEQTLAEEAARGTRSEPVTSDLVTDFGL
ncbi:MAG: hypothetical protein AB7N76_26465 [Planctomycetota bacterium]